MDENEWKDNIDESDINFLKAMVPHGWKSSILMKFHNVDEYFPRSQYPLYG